MFHHFLLNIPYKLSTSTRYKNVSALTTTWFMNNSPAQYGFASSQTSCLRGRTHFLLFHHTRQVKEMKKRKQKKNAADEPYESRPVQFSLSLCVSVISIQTGYSGLIQIFIQTWMAKASAVLKTVPIFYETTY